MPGFHGKVELAIAESRVFVLTSDILEQVVTQLVGEGILQKLPSQLYHFTSLETAYRIIQEDNIRLSHAEYSNDQTEMEEAKKIILSELNKRSSNSFFGHVLSEYEMLAPTLNAYVCCMSTGNPACNPPQDILSQWRAYGQDGRGACLTLDATKLARLV